MILVYKRQHMLTKANSVLEWRTEANSVLEWKILTKSFSSTIGAGFQLWISTLPPQKERQSERNLDLPKPQKQYLCVPAFNTFS